MIYKMELSDSTDTMVFDLLEVPIEDKDVTGVASNTTIDGNVFNDYLWLKKQYVQKWSIMCQDEYERLRGFWTRQFGNAEVPFYRLFYGDNVYEDKNFLTSDGMTQILNPTERTAPLLEYSLYGNATQETTTGKNKTQNLGAYYDAGFSANAGASITSHTDGSIVFTTGTTGSSGIFMSKAKIDTICPQIYQDGYTVSLTIVSTQATNIKFNYNSKNTTVSVGTTATRISFQTDGSETGPVVLYKATNGITPTLTISDIQVEAGSTATDFEPYCGGVPSPNPDYPQTVNVVTGEQTVKIMGKNLFDRANATENVLLKWVEGTPSADSGSIVSDYIYMSEGTTIASNYVFYIFCYDGSENYLGALQVGGTTIAKRTGTAVYHGTIPSGYGTKYVRIVWRSSINGGADMTQQDIMLNHGSTAEPFEPYQGQTYEINLGGTNLIDTRNLSDTTTGGVTTTWTNNVGTANGTTTTTSFLATGDITQTIPAGTYTFSVQTAIPYRFVFALWNPNTSAWVGSYISANQTSVNFTTNFDATRWRIGVASISAGTTVTNLKIDRPMLQKGSEATTYVPYTTYAYELAGVGEIQPDGLPKYRDYIWNDGGTWKIHREVGKQTFTGSEAWYLFGNNSGFFLAVSDALAPTSPTTADTELVISDNYSACLFNDIYTSAVNYGVSLYGATNPINRICFRNKDCATANDFKTWLSTHNTTVYYALATPTDTEITDSELVEQLDAILDGSLYVGQNNIFLIPSGGAQGEIAGDYRLIYEEETDIIPKTPVVLTLSDGGVINPCGCRQNIQLIMRETKGSE